MVDETSIAVVGLAYRAPGVGRKGLWDFLAEAKSAWSKVPADRFDQDAYYHPDAGKAGCFSSQGGHFLPDDVYGFDAPFFNLRADEARAIDPHHRILLECALEAAESAGHSLTDIAGANIGVFAAIGSTEYGQQVAEDLPSSNTWTAAGTAPCMFANRLSYFFDLTGPSIALDAACASSSYAVNLACQSLRAGECNAAFVGASALLLGPNQWTLLDNMGALSAEGKCFSYDIKASGFGRGEGAACLLVKRLADAIECGDPIHAVIRNSASNHSGRSEGITMPKREAQENLLRRVHEEIGLNPGETPVVEGHGTGTKAGDPIEAGAFVTVLASQRTSSNPLYIGSLKSNFGHLESASGILGMIKAILMLQKGLVLPNADFEEFNPDIEGRDKLKIARKAVPWPANAAKRVVVTNFGFGGSNAAVILEKAPAVLRSPETPTNGDRNINGNIRTTSNGHMDSNNRIHGNGATNDNSHVDTKGPTSATKLKNGTSLSNSTATGNGHGKDNHFSHKPVQRLFVFSAKSEASLSSYLASFTEYLDTAPESADFAKDLVFTLGQRRTHHPYRVAVPANSVESLKAQLSSAKVSKSKDRNIAFVFTGQGAQHAQMASGLRHHKPFSAALSKAEAYLNSMGSSWSLLEELSKPESDSRINDAEISQPACTAIQLALVVLLKSWGITPDTVTGHSSGEIAAAFAVNLISFRTAMAIAYFRGVVAARLARKGSQRGAMLALGVSSDIASELIQQSADGGAVVAAINSPESVTVSGDEAAIEEIQQIADARGLFARKLKVDVAYHSHHMKQVADEYLVSITPFCDEGSPSTQAECSQASFVSSVTGAIETSDTLGATYWVKNLLQPVRFTDALEGIFSSSSEEGNTVQRNAKLPNVVVEIGPHCALKTPIKQTLGKLRERNDQPKTPFTYLPSLVRGTSADEALLGLAGNLFSIGVSIHLAMVNETNTHNAKFVTDLPPYVWDKSVRYVHRSRLAQEKLHPGLPYHPLLGWKTPSSGNGEYTFRQVFTLDDMPWIRDHNVAGTVVLPMTTYLSMAMEAMRRVTPKVPSALLIREFHAKRSLEIEEDERVDITTRLRPAITGTENYSSTEWTFEILTCSEEHGWTTHCYGRIEPEANEMTMETRTLKASAPLTDTKNLKDRNPEHEYGAVSQEGTRYGPAFLSMRGLWEGSDWTVLESELREMDLSSPSPYGSPVTVDTPTLDGFLQGLGPLHEVDGKRPALMPNYVSRLRVSNHIPAVPNQRFTVVTRLLDRDAKAGSLHISVAAFAQCSGKLTPVAEWESVTFRTLDLSHDTAETLPTSYAWDLVPSLDSASDEHLATIFVADPPDEDELRCRRNLNAAAVVYMDRALKETAGDDFSKVPSHIAKFAAWARSVVAREQLALVDDPASRLAEVSKYDARGEMLCAVGEQLVPILRGEIEPLEIMLKDNRLSRHYEDDVSNVRSSRMLAKWVRHLSDANPELRVLEIGAGTGSATIPILEELSQRVEESPTCLSYTYTDISPGFFENARKKLAQWSQRITFKKLDISQDPQSQGFVTEDFDLVIASNCLHATPNFAVTLDHVRTLMKPNGKLLMLEATCHPPLTLPFALLPGWWLAEDEYRSHEEGPLLSEETWHRLLTEQGFSGVDRAIADYPETSDHVLSVIGSTRIGIHEDSHDLETITICGLINNDEEEEFAQMVADHIAEQLGCETSVKPLAEVDAVSDPFCIFIDSSHQSILSNIANDVFETLRSFLLDTPGVLWIIPEDHPPEAEIMKGMLRSLRLETGSKNLILLENAPCTSEGASAIVQVAKRLQDPEFSRSVDQDFVWHNNMIHLPRFRPLATAREAFASEAGVPIQTMQNMWECKDGLELTVEAAGSPDSIYFRRTDVLEQSLADDDVLIKSEAAGVNFRDLLLVLGSIPWTTPGFEGVGVVTRIGSRVSDLQPGDRVFYGTLGGGSFATYVRIPAWGACKIPDNVSSADAASMPVAYSTAIMALMRIARLRKGESVLVHAASGAVGQACIVLAQHIGAQIFATAGSPTKREFLQKTFSIPKENIFSSRTTGFRDGILCATNGKGVDVIVNSLSGNFLQETWALVADFGRFVEIGKRDFLQNSFLEMKPFDRNVTFSGVDLRTYFHKKPEEMREVLLEIVDLLQQGIIVPIQPVTTIPISQIGKGLRKLQSGQNIGKIVVTMGPDECVLAQSAPALGPSSGQLLRQDATYLITGGTGGIGFALGSWMIENGARNVVLLGRSGDSRPEVKKLLKQHEGTDVQLRAVACDVGSRIELEKALHSVSDLPPVRGVVHGALYLRDSMLENASYDDWQKITQPRVQGAWNLHELLPELEFFIPLSSFLGAVGNIGQSIYAGTANFFDAFADYRNSRGQPTVSISLPVVLDIGYVADRDLTETLKGSLKAIIGEAHLKTVVKGAIIGPTSGLNHDGKAISFSLASGADINAPGWQRFHPKTLVDRINSDKQGTQSNGLGHGGDNGSNGGATNGDPVLALLDALMTKVSAITMIDKDDIEADAPTSKYSLDSLVSVELRNWIRRETGVELPLTAIVRAGTLRALTTNILGQKLR